MIDYVFFDAALSREFAGAAQGMGIAAELSEDEGTFNVALPEDLADDVTERLEALYDDLMERQAEIVEESEPTLRHAAGVHINLADGTPCLIRIPPQIMNRLMSVMSVAELHEFISGVAHDIENPHSGPICHTPD